MEDAAESHARGGTDMGTPRSGTGTLNMAQVLFPMPTELQKLGNGLSTARPNRKIRR